MQVIGRKNPTGMRKIRQDKGQMRWTECDLAVLRWIGEQYAIRMDQLQGRLGQLASEPTQEPDVLGIETTRKLVQRWMGAGLGLVDAKGPGTGRAGVSDLVSEDPGVATPLRAQPGAGVGGTARTGGNLAFRSAARLQRC